MWPTTLAVLCVVAAAIPRLVAAGQTYNFAVEGARAEDPTLAACDHNTGVLNATLARLRPGDVFLVPNRTFWLQGGVSASGLTGVTLQIDGTLAFSNNQKAWPRNPDGSVLECISLSNLVNVTLTSSGEGTFFGNGRDWWGAVQYLLIGENRPRLLRVDGAQNVVIEHVLFKDSPYWTVYVTNADGLEIRHAAVDARVDHAPDHDRRDLTAFNTWAAGHWAQRAAAPAHCGLVLCGQGWV